MQAADDAEPVTIGLEQLEDVLELEAVARGIRRPAVHDRAVREVDEPEPRADCRRLAESRHHRIQQRQR